MVSVWSTVIREALETRVPGIDEDVQVKTRDIGQVRCDLLGGRIVVEFVVDDDPHVYAMLPHHLQQVAVLLFEPLYPNVVLIPHPEELW